MFATRALFARSVWKGVCKSYNLKKARLTHHQDHTSSRKSTLQHHHHHHHHPPLSLSSAFSSNPHLCTCLTTPYTISSLPIPRSTDIAAALAAGTRLPPIRTQARAATILPNFVGLRFAIHNGKSYQEVEITEDMVGRKLGEFVATRRRFVYKLSKNK
jgi:ribosomal protein S19